MTLPSLIESGIAEFRKKFVEYYRKIPQGLKEEASPEEIESFLTSFATNVHNAALEEALRILEDLYILESGKDDYEHERLLGRNKVLEEARAKLSALKV